MDVVNCNKRKDRSLLLEVNIKRAWTDTMRNLNLDDRIEEMNTKTGKSAILARTSIAEFVAHRRASTIHDSRTRWHTASVLTDVDVSEYKIPNLGSKHLEAVKYSHFVKQVQQPNEGKPFTQEVVDACFWSMVDVLLKKAGNKDRVGKILNEAKGVIGQADTHWETL